MSRVTTVEAAAIADFSMAILEQARTFLWQIPIPTCHTFAATVRNCPGHTLPEQAWVALLSQRDHTANAFMTENRWRWLDSPSVDGMQIGCTNRGQRDFDEDLARPTFRQR